MKVSFYYGFLGNRSCRVLIMITMIFEITDFTLTYLVEDLSGSSLKLV